MAYQTKNTRTHSSVPNPDNNNPAWPSLKLLGSSTLCLVVIVRNTSQNGIIPAASFVRPYVAHICFVFLLKDLSLTSERPSKLILWSSFRLWAVALQGGGGTPPSKTVIYTRTCCWQQQHTFRSQSVDQPNNTLPHTLKLKEGRKNALTRLCVCVSVASCFHLSFYRLNIRNQETHTCMYVCKCKRIGRSKKCRYQS